uniref:Putative secreted protein n=1 Tax=Anopheles darlingi TaxID=43151 RepID=A0A2M4DEE7_ANODA
MIATPAPFVFYRFLTATSALAIVVMKRTLKARESGAILFEFQLHSVEMQEPWWCLVLKRGKTGRGAKVT